MLYLIRCLLACSFVCALPHLAAKQGKLTFLHFNDIYEINSTAGLGGAASLMTALKQARAESKNSITIVSGDFLSPSIVSEFTKGSHMVALFNAMHVDLATLGNHEFDFGLPVLKERMREASFVWLNNNILDENQKPFEGTTSTLIKEIDGVKVGFAGLLTPRTRELSQNVKSLRFIDPLTAAQNSVKTLKDQGAEVIVLVTHLEMSQDRRIAQNVKGVDLILGGHDHTPMTYYGNNVLIQKSGSDGRFLGIVNLDVRFSKDQNNQQIKRIIPSWCVRSIFELKPDPEIAAKVASYTDKLNKELDVEVAKTAYELDSRYTLVRAKESTMGELLADALKEQTKADAALINGGAVRGDRHYLAGSKLTRKDLHKEFPFNNVVVVIELKGSDLLKALEHGFASLPQPDGRFPQVSGMTIHYDPQAPAHHRVISVLIGKEPLDEGKVYRLATLDFLLSGGDGYDMLKNGEVVLGAEYGPLLINSLLDYLQKNPLIQIRGERLISQESSAS